MTLKSLDSSADFTIGPDWFVSYFDVYDREQSLGVELGKFDPNDPDQLTDLLRQHFFEDPWIVRHNAEHRIVMLRVLQQALDSNMDFAPLFDRWAYTERPDFYSLPGSREVRDPRAFFEELYRLAREYWASK